MKTAILRRRKLGKTSCAEIKKLSSEDIQVIRNDHRIPDDLDIVFRWGCTSNIPGMPLITNNAKAIHLVSDKSAFRAVLEAEGLCPKTWFRTDDDITYPCIVRPRYHHQGRNVHYCTDAIELSIACALCGVDYYISEYIDKVAEYRIFVVQGRCVCVAKKTPADENAIAWNVAQGGRFDSVRWSDWPLKAVKIGIQAFNLSGLDFGGVDVMVDGEGECYVLEINSAPSLTSPYRQQCMAKAFDYIIREGKEHFQNIGELPKGGYKKFIHPAIFEE